ncbi:hypothetical protein IEO21_06748 [Rhodonia placenta]|uniref:Uncharacterized protein n=1 Tax=Rhodonia placenta TaxID=104341 RepID=A0A8H7NZG0_9APHY|nr:hypothetical protein IEO21_06748 [Postia placenta]
MRLRASHRVNGTLTQIHDPGYISRSGPSTERGTGSQHKKGKSSRGNETLKCDQCIFIHYYKMKKRLKICPIIMKAAAGPKDPDTGPPDDDDDFETEEVPSNAKHAPESTSAITSDFDLRLLCKDSDIPDDIHDVILRR